MRSDSGLVPIAGGWLAVVAALPSNASPLLWLPCSLAFSFSSLPISAWIFSAQCASHQEHFDLIGEGDAVREGRAAACEAFLCFGQVCRMSG